MSLKSWLKAMKRMYDPPNFLSRFQNLPNEILTTFTFWAVAQPNLDQFLIFWSLQRAKTLRISKTSLKRSNKAMQRLCGLPKPVHEVSLHPLHTLKSGQSFSFMRLFIGAKLPDKEKFEG